MDSQLTLVNQEPPLELVLEKPATPLNTRIFVNGKPRYKVSTVDRDGNVTDVTDLRTNAVVATIKRRSILPDKVKFPAKFGGKAVKKDDWMVETKLDSGGLGWTINSESGSFLWRFDKALKIVLTPATDPDRIIAFVKSEPGVYALCVEHRAEGLLDEIIPGFIVLDHQNNMMTKSWKVADGWCADERSTITGRPLAGDYTK
ncbi:hypothetical protein CC1G_09566 [Coprinopsis cinerea okayama7|uniref:DUF6593 domain-containing protein n=1 Tax=Coprinopsis cinerea (strain Okayama-7 / 130 / ATCC MYA-4618 / FGSC 9003) TaxID=240176 RepID=A8P972_COPC7|nr:hypothetical protein CC1G_09566 [Coprinopsis cinerea okayama7\|eukprot:XP_001839711.1 hypothetical protein CC1G_09566 [Coprinopsis cinerea okayama7\